jgi:hypothetical protein
VYPASGAFASLTLNGTAALTLPKAADWGLKFTGDALFTVNSGCSIAMEDNTALGAAYTGYFSFTPTTDGASGLVIAAGASVTIKGATKDHFGTLDADIGGWAAYGDVLPIVDVTDIALAAAPTGWGVGDILVFAPTGRTSSHWDTVKIASVATHHVTVGATWRGTAPLYADGANARPLWNHQGEGTPTLARAEVLNLTRNIRIYSTSASLGAYIGIATTAVVVMNYVECYQVGSVTSTRRGIAIGTTTTPGSVAMTGVVVHDSRYGHYNVTGLTTGSVILNSCIGWQTGTTNASHGFLITSLSLSGAGALTVTSHIEGFVQTTGSLYGYDIQDVGCTLPSCRSVGNIHYGFRVSDQVTLVDGFLDNAVAHSNGNHGFALGCYFTPETAISGAISWRNAVYGFAGYAGVNMLGRIYLTSPISFGHATANFGSLGAGDLFVTTPNNIQDMGLAGEGALALYVGGGSRAWFVGGTLNGGTSLKASVNTFNNVTLTNFAAPTFVAADSALGCCLLSFRHNTQADDHRMYFKYGYILSEPTTRHTASGLSWQHFPTGAVGTWFRPNITYKIAVDANVPVTISAWVRVLTVANGGSYNGTSYPRLTVLGGILQGVPTDVSSDAWTDPGGSPGVPPDHWAQLTKQVTPTETGVLEFVVEGQGTTGSYYVDDIGAAV